MADVVQLHWWGDEYGWNISAAVKLVAGREPMQADISAWVVELPWATINNDHWPSVDLTRPLIVVPMPGTDDLRLIDGWHRVRRASSEGLTILPAHVLSREEERMVRGYGGDAP